MKSKVIEAQAIAEGDVNLSVNVASENDVMGQYLNTINSNLQTVYGRMQEVTHEVQIGFLDKTAPETGLTNGWGALIQPIINL